jgi:predicted Zn-dependent protease
MPEDPLEAEFQILRRLKEVGAKFRKGWAKSHPIAEKHLAAVRTQVQKDWQEEKQSKSTPKAESKKKSVKQEQEKTSEESQSKGKSQSH